jgi:nucleoid DNA-binding protein
MAKAKAAPAKAAPKKAMTKTALFADLAEKTELTKKQIEAVFDELSKVIVHQLGSKGPGKILLPGLFRLKAIKKAKVKGGEKKENKLKPGTFYVTKDKPAHTKVTAQPVKDLKEALSPGA